FKNMEEKPHIAIFPTPGMGHLIPLGEFAKRLVFIHHFSVTFILPTDGPLSASQKSFLDSLPVTVSKLLLPAVDLSDLSEDVKIETRICLTVARSLPHLHAALNSLLSASRLVALIVDLFGTDAFDVAAELKVSPFIFFPSTAMGLCLAFYLPELDESVSSEYRDLPNPVQIPGCVPVHGRDFPDPAQERTNDAYKWLLHHTKRYRLAEGIMVNSFKDLEYRPIKFLLEEKPGKPPVYPIGPLIRMDPNPGSDGSHCIPWLNDQPHGSVLYISFGSGGILSYHQLTELAIGLEMSEQRFLWVVRTPNDKASSASYFSIYGRDQNDPLAFLPEGFVERTRGVGLTVVSWAPQAEILHHGSSGGFLTHCGWNSTLESVVNGVPMIAWPLYAEQKMNAVLLTEDLKVALRPKSGENGVVGREEIAAVVRGLMEGEEGKRLRSRMSELKDGAARALSEDGESTWALAELAQKWKNKIID
ncbi:hydroquinone glucosyltransferase, partial [Sarracenia purpurea var. burkii]